MMGYKNPAERETSLADNWPPRNHVKQNSMRCRSPQPVWVALFILGFFGSVRASAAPLTSRGWMVLLDEPPAVERYPGRFATTRAAAEPYRAHLRQMQSNLRAQVEARNVRVTGTVQHLLNALFVKATPAQAAALRTLPG